MIYAMQCDEGGPIKIGYTDNVDRRHAQLQRTYKRGLAVLAVMEGDLETERQIHERFAHLRIGRTEQFQPALELMEFLGLPLFASQAEVEAMDKPSDKSVLTVRCRIRYKEWVSEFAKERRLDVPALIDTALVELAKACGKPEPPQRLFED